MRAGPEAGDRPPGWVGGHSRGCPRRRGAPRSRWARGGGERRACGTSGPASRTHPLGARPRRGRAEAGRDRAPGRSPGWCGTRPGSRGVWIGLWSFLEPLCGGEKKQRISLVQESRFDFNCAFLEVLEAEPKTLAWRGEGDTSSFYLLKDIWD